MLCKDSFKCFFDCSVMRLVIYTTTTYFILMLYVTPFVVYNGECFPKSFQWDGRKLNAYTQIELDEVRCEWTDFVSNYV